MAADTRVVLAALPLVAAALARKRATDVQDREEAWRQWLLKHAPPAFIDYIWDIDEEIQVIESLVYVDQVAPWLKQQHPLQQEAVDALLRAVEQGVDARLPYMQASVIQTAWWTLGLAYARDRQPLTGGVHHNNVVQKMAAEALLQLLPHEVVAAAHNAPAELVSRWCTHGCSDTATLERATLFRPELRFLSASQQ